MMRLGAVGVASCVLVATVSLTPLAASADSITTIGFEDLADGAAVGAQYSGLGVQLAPAASAPATSLAVQASDVAHGGAKVMLAMDSTCGSGSAITFSVLLSTPRNQVGLWLRDANPADMSSHQVGMNGFAADNSSASMTSLSITASLGWQELLLVADPGKTIDHAVVTVAPGVCQMLFDDLNFDAPASVQPPAVALEDAPATAVAVERGGTTTTSATLRRNNGSTGRVNLAVSGLPTGVTAVVSPAQANGSDLRGPVSIALSGTTTAPATASPVQATLTATPVDSTAGPATPVTTTFPVTVVPPSVTLAVATAPSQLLPGTTATITATMTRHSLSTGLVSLAATGPAGVTLTVSPATVDGSAPSTALTITAAVAADAARAPDGQIHLVATSADPAAAPPGQQATLDIAVPVRVPSLVITSILPKTTLVLRAGTGYARLDAHITATDLPPGTIVTSSISGVPASVQVTTSPATFPASDGTGLFYAELTAPTGFGESTGYVTITSSYQVAGQLPVTTSAREELIVVPTIRYGLVVRGIEVTQGTQTIGPTGSSIPTRYFDHPESSVPYTGVKLVDGDLTVARVYVDAWYLTNTKSLPNVGVVLHGFRNGKELPGTLLPSAAPTSVSQGSLFAVTDADRSTDDNVYTFVLPPSFTQGSLTLQAEILPLPPTVDGKVLDACSTPLCRLLQRFTLRSITFNRLQWPSIFTVRVTANGAVPKAADQVLKSAIDLDPGTPYVTGYLADIDISDLVKQAAAAAADPKSKLTGRDIVEGGAAARVSQWAHTVDGRVIVMGVAAGSIGNIAGVENGYTLADLPVKLTTSPRPSLLVTESRPLTSVAHELAHALGRPHAGQACPGTGPKDPQAGEQWLPDDQGYLQGVGIDLWGIDPQPSAYTQSATHPYRLLYPNTPGSAINLYDYMSYCAATVEVPTATTAPNTWLSPRGWDDEVNALELWTSRTGGAFGPQTVAAAKPATTPVVTVDAIGRGSSAMVLSADPARGTPTPVSASTVVLVGYNKAGAKVSTAGLVHTVTDDSGLDSYTGSIAAAGVARVAVEDATGVVMAERHQSAHAPKVTVTSPKAGSSVGGKKSVRVTWKATDADHDKLTESVEVSADGGRTWRGVYSGSASSVLLPARYFLASARSVVRVTANDGFRSTSAVSKTFRALAARADVHIDSPSTKASFNSNASITLKGSASTVAGPVASSRLVWYLDGRVIAHGAAVAVTNLPPGHRTLTLKVAGDSGPGARIAVVVRAVTPAFLAVSLPAKVTAKATYVTVHIKSGAAVTIMSGGKSVAIKARHSGVLRVPVKPGHGYLVITLTAEALRNKYTFTRVVARP